jgi:hypothetical protein
LVGFVLLAVWCGARVWRAAETEAAPVEASTADTPPTAPAGRRWFWFLLPACAVVLLLATTNTLCQDIAVIPFLWILPLSLYLLSFIVCFDSPRWYRRRFWLPLLAVALTASAGALLGHHEAALLGFWAPIPWLAGLGADFTMYQELGIHLATLFICCMACHGEVYRLRPEADGLTGFYLSLSAGGACGGLFVAVGAPLLLDHHGEFQAALLLSAVLVLGVLAIDTGSPLHQGRRPWAWATLALGTALLAAAPRTTVLRFGPLVGTDDDCVWPLVTTLRERGVVRLPRGLPPFLPLLLEDAARAANRLADAGGVHVLRGPERLTTEQLGALVVDRFGGRWAWRWIGGAAAHARLRAWEHLPDRWDDGALGPRQTLASWIGGCRACDESDKTVRHPGRPHG